MRWASAGRTAAVIAASGLAAAACTSGARPHPSPAPPARLSGGPAAVDCPVSRPSSHRPLPPSPSVRFINGEYLPGNSNGYGNADLWTGLPVNGQLVTNRLPGHKGYVAMMGWWLVHPGKLTVTATKLDGSPHGPSHGFAADVRTTAYSAHDGFRLSRMVFPSRGCWRITGIMRGRHPLTFTVHVVGTGPSRRGPSPDGSGDEWHVTIAPS